MPATQTKDEQSETTGIGQPAHMAAPPMIGTPPDGSPAAGSYHRVKADAQAVADRANELEAMRVQPGEEPRLKMVVEKNPDDPDGGDDRWVIVRNVVNADKGGPNIGTPRDGVWPMDTLLDDDA